MSAVQVENLTFSYSRHGRNLENINMVVPRGAIYGLLGPSGCCKTTLLRIIVGRLKPKSGCVYVFGYRPGTAKSGIPGPNVGYMPQEISLISQFTVRETLEYYAGFARQLEDREPLDKKIKFLLDLLDLSDFEHVYSDRLSGGQQRRVSLAIALINDPPLLILDEPTVGVDPILREAIWSYLVSHSKKGLTVIVTTHYIEEAIVSDKVGFMRQGRILAEGNPEQLMNFYRTPTLEKLFLKLAHSDDFRSTTVGGGGENTGNNDNRTLVVASSGVHQRLQSKSRSKKEATDPELGLEGVFHSSGSTTDLANIAETQFHASALANGSSPANDPNGAISNQKATNFDVYLTNNNNNNNLSKMQGLTITNNNNNNNSDQSTSLDLVASTTTTTIVATKSDSMPRRTFAGRTCSTLAQSRQVGTMHKINVLCRKHRLRLFRRVSELVITMLLPALEVALFCLCMGRDPTAIQMAVCNQESPPFMSTVFLQSIDSDFIALKYYKTPEEAINSVRNADTYSAIVLAKNFTMDLQNFGGGSKIAMNVGGALDARLIQQLMPGLGLTTTEPMDFRRKPHQGTTPTMLTSDPDDERFLGTPGSSTARPTTATPATNLVSSTPVSTFLDPEANDYVDDSIIKIYYDGSNALHVNIIRREVFSALFRFAKTMGDSIGGKFAGFKLPIKFEKPIYGTEKTDMIEFVGPGLMVFIVFFATMSITSMAFLSERREGTLERSLIVGMTPTEFIISQMINITFLLIVQITLTVVMGFGIFDFPMKGSYILAVAMMFLQGLCGMAYGLMLSAICTNEMGSLLLGAGSQLMFCFITGIFWPVDTMIAFLRYISYLLPQTKPMESFRHILIRGFDLSKPAVYNGYLITIFWIGFFLIMAIAIFRFR